MSAIWVVVAESSRARLFVADTPRGPLREIESLEHPKARLHEQELVSDRPGRAFDRAGEGRHAMEPRVDPKEHEAEVFARTVADRLEQLRLKNGVKKVVVAAAPPFLGLLRKRMSEPLRRLVSAEIDKDLVPLRPEEIRAHLPERL